MTGIESRPPRWWAQAEFASASAHPSTTNVGAESRPQAAPARGPEIFVEAAADTGFVFYHHNGATGGLTLPEIMGAGVALFDYDNDDDLDVYLVQGGRQLAAPPDSGAPGERRDQLLRNDSDRHHVRFSDASARAGIADDDYGMGVAAGDYDGDGFVDLYVLNLGENRLLHNDHGRFSDVTEAAGAGDPSWSVSAAFVDFDRDGWLDLYVANYVSWETHREVRCYAPSSRRDYCGPAAYPEAVDRFLRNRGDGTFVPVLAQPLAAAPGPGLGVVPGDFDQDGWPEIYVANDGGANVLWRHEGAQLVDLALPWGIALNRSGLAEASMGVSAGDLDNDGDLDLFLTHLTRETNTLYVNEAPGSFEDRSLESGLGAPSLPYTGFGGGFLDWDNDGLLDVLVVNGAVKLAEDASEGLGQPKLLFRNRDGAHFDAVTAEAGAWLERREVGRGAAFGDIDNDGDTDVVYTTNNGPARLLLNQVGQSRRSLRLRLLTRDGRRDALGAWVAVAQSTRTLWRTAETAGSYASAHDPRVLVGLGNERDLRSIVVRWPDGVPERFGVGTVRGNDATLVLRQGTGAPVDHDR